jgi:hypothetical protein
MAPALSGTTSMNQSDPRAEADFLGHLHTTEMWERFLLRNAHAARPLRGEVPTAATAMAASRARAVRVCRKHIWSLGYRPSADLRSLYHRT